MNKQRERSHTGSHFTAEQGIQNLTDAQKRGVSAASEKALASLRLRIGYVVAVARTGEPVPTTSAQHFTHNIFPFLIFVATGEMQRDICFFGEVM